MRLPIEHYEDDLRRNSAPAYLFQRQDWADNASDSDVRRARILNILGYTKTSGSAYAAKQYPAGYHEITIGDETFPGQRSPQSRLKHLPFDFEGKTLLDIGCNQGGMVFALHNKVKWAVGLDFDYKMINACNLITTEKDTDNTNFYVFDIDKDPHELILDLLPEERVDVVFLLAVCMWVDRWREIIRFASKISNVMVFETNGTDSQQDEQIEFLRHIFRDVTLLTKSSDDDPKQKRRQLLIAKNG